MMKTKALKGHDIKRSWHLIDAKGQTLGKMAVNISNILTAKDKVNYTPNIDNGDYVVVINASKIYLSGKKEDRKVYYRYTGYPSGLRTESLKNLKQRRPDEVVRKAISGMLGRNRLHDRRLARLFIYKGAEHPHAAQLGGSNAKS